MTDAPGPTPSVPLVRRLARRRTRRRALIATYAALLLASHAFLLARAQRAQPLPDGLRLIDLPAMGERGPVEGAPAPLAVHSWPAPLRSNLPPVILLHGSPGDGAGFDLLALRLAAAGRDVYAPDLPGFGHSTADVPSMSMLAHARAVLALMDALGADRAHLVGWSNGGGVALHAADLAPDRIASLTLLAAIGDQAFEGSGNYWFEHFKYALGYATLGAVPELVPHFGLLGTFTGRTAFLRNFWESDQRPLRAIMQRLQVPALILHGRADMLVPVRAALGHHALIPSSRLVVIDADHFIPFMQPAEGAAHLVPFLARHDAPGVSAERATLDLAPEPPRRGLLGAAATVGDHLHRAPWWADAGAIAAVAAFAPAAAIIAAALLVVGSDLDPLVVIVGVLAGLIAQAVAVAGRVRSGLPVRGASGVSATDWSRRLATRPFGEGWRSGLIGALRAPGAVGAMSVAGPRGARLRFAAGRFTGMAAWSVGAVLLAIAGAAFIVRPTERDHGTLAGVAAAVGVALVASTLPTLVSRRARQRLAARLARLFHHEWWDVRFFYLPLQPYLLYLAVRHGGFTVPTAANPGIENGGGFIGESKHAITTALGPSPFVLPTVLVPPHGDPDVRALIVRDAMVAGPDMDRYPIILKPDAGQRGYAVRLCRNDADVRAYLATMTAPAVAQPYHPGPCECGILWVRTIGAPPGGPAGRIFGVTRKDFPTVTGDGERTLEDLIHAHPRLRLQAGIFLARFAGESSRVLGEGEVLRLAVSGNHCQGTRFSDGTDLVTPALSAAIDALASGFGGGDALDYGRFDLRYESDEALRAGRGFGVVELNGLTGESTNLYDPERSVFWAYEILFRQWRALYELGAWRRDSGHRPIPLRAVFGLMRAHYATRRGSALAD